MALLSCRRSSTHGGGIAALAVGTFLAVAAHPLPASGQCPSASLSGMAADYYPLGTVASSTLADFNHDGHLDAATTAYVVPRGGVVLVQLGDGTGRLAPPSTVVVGVGVQAYRVLALDLNHDANADLVLAFSGGLAILLGNGAGGFGPPSFVSSGNHEDVASADFNGDGHPDLIAPAGFDSVAVLMGDGAGGFSVTTIAVGPSTFTAVAVGDFNGDTRPDAVAAGLTPARLVVLLNNAAGGFTQVPAVPPGVGGPRSIASADFNQDSHLDVLVGYDAGLDVSVLWGDGSGSFAAFDNLEVGAAPKVVVAEDVDGDGRQDVIVSVTEPASVAVVRRTSSGFAALQRTSLAKPPFTLALGDLDEDDRVDLSAAVPQGLAAALGQGNGLFGAAAALATPFPTGVLIADVNADGKADLVAGSGGLRAFLGDGAGSFGAPVVSTSNGDVFGMASGFFNDDAHLDLVVTIPGFGAFLMPGDGQGAFGSAGILSAFVSSDPAVADFNGDGNSDVAIASTSNGIVVLLGDGRGAFVAGPVINVSASSLIAVDANGDNHVDLVAGLSTAEVMFVAGNGAGGFGLPRLFPAFAQVTGVAAADFNGDSRVDFAVTHGDASGVSVLLGLGASQFGPPTHYPGTDNNRSPVITDVNLDGKADLVIISSWVGTVSVMLGDGAGAFVHDASWMATALPTAVAVGRIDCDAKDDVVLANTTVSALTLHFNACGGSVGPPTVTGVQPASGADAGGTPVTITGTNFRPGATVQIGGVPATDVVVSSFTHLTARTGPHAPGAVDVAVTNPPVPCVTAAGVLAGAFTYLPRLTVAGASVTEGNAGTVDVELPVTLSAATDATVTVGFATSDLTATAPSDYTSVSGVLTFTPGATSRTVTVPVAGDVLDEPSERFRVTLGSPGQALVESGQADGLIRDDDGTTISTIELTHGHVVAGDLAAQPGPLSTQDLYLLSQRGRSSYEVVVDASSGGVAGAGGPLVQRILPDLTTVVQESAATGTGSARSLRWENTSAGDAPVHYIRVKSGGCTTTCDANATYRIRAYETTASVPRFNNGGSQITVLVLGNASNASLAGHIWFWSPGGSLVGTQAFAIAARGSFVLNTATVAPGTGGSLTISHDGRYGDLVGKTVAVEPASGFSFDSPALLRAK